MTDIEAKALALLNEMRGCTLLDFDAAVHFTSKEYLAKTICRAIEQHEAFKREVSDAVELRFGRFRPDYGCLDRFVLSRATPLEAALQEVGCAPWPETATRLRAAIEARGGRIVWEGE